ncbi:MAG: DUF1850 domain-containing protein [Lachnospiraceae bacterium]|nr:DUF1850 domain-containing protein [Lachnospiraceae bacterium]
MKKILLRLTALILLLSVLFILFFLPRKYLVVSYQKTGEVICRTAVRSGSTVEVALTHSFEHVPWNEYYTVTETDTFLLNKITVAGYGAGIPAEMDVTTRIEDGLVVMEGINSEFPCFNWITSQTNMKTLTVDGSVILSFDSIPNHSFVEATIKTNRGLLFNG